MDKIIASSSHRYRIFFSVLTALVLLSIIFAFSNYRASAEAVVSSANEHIIAVHDGGVDKGFITKKSTLREAFAEQHIRIDPKDFVEPGLDSKLMASSYQVNIYRARLVAINDGKVETKVITAYRTAGQIAKEAGVTLHDADITKLSPSMDPLANGAAEVMTITRATPFSFNFYGKIEQAYTQGKTVGDMLKEKHIKMGPKDGVSPATSTPITVGMTIRIWRDGVQTVTQNEDVPFDTKTVQDADQPVGYKKVQTPGTNGQKTVTYEVNMQNGAEVSRKEINSVVLTQPSEEVVVIGTKSRGGLTKSMGVNSYVDSNGVVHRETYYDLPMNIVMRNCGAGGNYTVRADGAKVDKDGYVLIAANLARYPRCSIVETSIGLGKVYDTGGFVAHHPDGFDLATDWSNYNGL